ncbi:hypothetical protein V1506DRAFT_569406 [Lipomyces tetrasporus]
MNSKVILITVALTGIGRATALAFAKEQGARIIVSRRREDAGKSLVYELRALGAEAEFILTDVRHDDDGTPGPVVDQSEDSYHTTFDTNVLGVVLSMKHELRVMIAQGSGSIVNISSTYGHRHAAGASIYVASKYAVEGLTLSAALEVASSGTGMLDRFTGNEESKASMASTVPLKRIGSVEEIAEAVLYVASDRATFITGTILPVDGGKSAN